MMNLGIVYDSAGEMINHRSLLKVLLNPILRAFGFQIATECEMDYNTKKYVLGHPVFTRCPKIPFIQGIRMASYKLKDGDFVVRRRILI